MNKSKKILASACAFALAAPMFATPVFAATQSGTTNVSYDNTNSVPDPDHPTQPNWAVKIPSSIRFTDDSHGAPVNADVELVATNGGTDDSLPTNDVTITVASANNYTMKIAGAADAASDPVDYALKYGEKVMSNSVTEVGKVNKNTKKILGVATMNGVAQKTAVHTDVLTFTIDNATGSI